MSWRFAINFFIRGSPNCPATSPDLTFLVCTRFNHVVTLRPTSAHAVDEALNTADPRARCLPLPPHGDEKWLSDEMRPQRDVRLVADPMAGFSQEQQTSLKRYSRLVAV